MSEIKPFSALRPSPEKVKQVASHSVERYSKKQINDILEHNPLSFLQIIYSGENDNEKYHEKLKAIRQRLDKFISRNVFIKEANPCFYLYRQIKNNRHHRGIIGLASVDDYNKGVIRIHEQTLEKKEEKLKEYLDVCGFNAEPVCLTYPHNKELNAIMRSKELTQPVYDFESDDAARHTVWLFDTNDETSAISAMFKQVPYIYIADGHHRAASSARLAELRKTNNQAHTGFEPYNFFTAAFFADDELTIHNYNRLVRDLNGLDEVGFLNELRLKFAVSEASEKAIEPAGKGEICLYISKKWFTLKPLPNELSNLDAVSNLDVSILSDFILSPVLHIKDLRNDKRIAFMPGIKPPADLMEYVDSGKMAAAFCLYPVSFEELLAVAKSGKEMPPKSTWIEPKLESGMLIYDFAG